MLSADWSDGVRWDPMGSDWVPMGSDVVRLGPMGSDWVISHTGLERGAEVRKSDFCLPKVGPRDATVYPQVENLQLYQLLLYKRNK